MKIKISKPDGTVIEAEGTAEECAALADLPVREVLRFVPQYVPAYPPQPVPSWQSWITWKEDWPVWGVGNAGCAGPTLGFTVTRSGALE